MFNLTMNVKVQGSESSVFISLKGTMEECLERIKEYNDNPIVSVVDAHINPWM